MSHWWRAHDDAIDDAKLLLLPSDRHRWAWFCLMCLASAYGGVLPSIEIVSVKLRTTKHKAAEIITTLVMATLLAEIEPGRFAPHNWSKRQFQSDVSTDRVKRFRERRRNVSETPPETETETEAETDKEADASLRARKRAARLPDAWMPSEQELEFARSRGLTAREIDGESERFRNYWHAKAGRDAAKLDWPATWRNWILNGIERRGVQNGRPQAAGGIIAAADDLLETIRSFDRPAPSEGGIRGGTGAPALRAIPKG